MIRSTNYAAERSKPASSQIGLLEGDRLRDEQCGTRKNKTEFQIKFACTIAYSAVLGYPLTRTVMNVGSLLVALFSNNV